MPVVFGSKLKLNRGIESIARVLELIKALCMIHDVPKRFINCQVLHEILAQSEGGRWWLWVDRVEIGLGT